MYISWYDSRGVCCASTGAPTARPPGGAAGLPASIAAPASPWRLNQVWLMLNKGSADKWNSQRAVMLTSLSSSSPCNCLSVSLQVSPEVAAAPAPSPAFYERLGRKQVSFILSVSSESQKCFVFWGIDCQEWSTTSLSKCLNMILSNSVIAIQPWIKISILDVWLELDLDPFLTLVVNHNSGCGLRRKKVIIPTNRLLLAIKQL